MTILTVDLVQPATGNKYHTLQAAIDAPADGIAPSARSPLTVQGMAAYAGVMTTFTGTDDDDKADAANGMLTGFTDGTVTDLQDGTGDTFNGGAGEDEVRGGGGDDSIVGGAGDDTL